VTEHAPDRTEPTTPSGGKTGWLIPALLAAALAVAFAAIFLRKAEATPALVRSGYRLTIAAVLLIPMVVRGSRSGRLQRTWRWAVVAGLLYGVHFGAWIWSLDLTTVAASVTLVAATPLFLAVVGVATGRDRPEGRLWLALALGAAGVAVIGGADLSLSARALGGDALAVLGAVAMAGYLLLVRRLGPDLEVWSFMGVACAVGAVTQMVPAALLGQDLTPSGHDLGFIALAAILPQLVGHVLFTWSLRHTTPTVVGITILSEPVGATFLAWIWLAEVPGATVLVGCALVLLSLVLSLVPARAWPPFAARSGR
jgi:drug/metabolite transporter (DMT)-like permease